MKIWVDDIRPMPEDFDIWCKTPSEFFNVVAYEVLAGRDIELVSLDHDAGDYAKYGGDYILCLKRLEEWKFQYGIEPCKRFYLHTGNPVGRENMRRIIKHCGWEEVETAEDFF